MLKVVFPEVSPLTGIPNKEDQIRVPLADAFIEDIGTQPSSSGAIPPARTLDWNGILTFPSRSIGLTCIAVGAIMAELISIESGLNHSSDKNELGLGSA